MATGNLSDAFGYVTQSMQNLNTQSALFATSTGTTLMQSLTGSYYQGGLAAGSERYMLTNNYHTYAPVELQAPQIQPEKFCDYHLGPCSKIHPMKRLVRAIERLRAEISGWHGDILERSPA